MRNEADLILERVAEKWREHLEMFRTNEEKLLNLAHILANMFIKEKFDNEYLRRLQCPTKKST